MRDAHDNLCRLWLLREYEPLMTRKGEEFIDGDEKWIMCMNAILSTQEM